MLADLARQGFRVCLWINSYLSHLSPAFAEAAAAGYFLRRPDGAVYVADVWHGSYPACGIVDFTNPEAVGWFPARCARCSGRGWRCSRPTSPRGCRRTRWPPTA